MVVDTCANHFAAVGHAPRLASLTPPAPQHTPTPRFQSSRTRTPTHPAPSVLTHSKRYTGSQLKASRGVRGVA
jgi:hypothetical protein